MTILRSVTGASLLVLACTAVAQGQTVRSVTREQARQEAFDHAPRLLMARSDTAAARAGVFASRLFPDPTALISYTQSVPRYHAELSIPLDLPWIRSARTAAAQSGRTGSELRLAFARVAARLDVDTAYTAALAAREQLALSRRNTLDADSLRRIATLRRDTGDASDLDVELADIYALQQANLHAADSLSAESSLLTLQAAMGLMTSELTIALADSLRRPAFDSTTPGSGALLPIAAAEADVRTAELALRLQRNSRIVEPTLTAGFETGDPSGSENGLLPMVGIAIPLPLVNRNRGNVALAEAELQRAQASLMAVRVESGGAIGRARRALEIALAQLDRDERLTVAATRVSAMSLTAYREGAATLASVLEAQRMARDARSQYVTDLAAAWTARDVLQLLTETVAASVP
ncbi:MAG: TolC family protein [Gemmatimonadota bacterium]